MKKTWVELKKGYIIEIGAVRSVSTGEPGSMDNSRYLFIRFSGEKSAMTVTFDSTDERWAGYEKIKKALCEEDEAVPC